MKLAVLGPKGTYSDIAANEYNPNIEKEYFRSISEVIKSINDSRYAIIPYENSLDGFVSNSMDLLISEGCQIIDELYLPISFSVVGNVSREEDIKKIYVQFKAKGQCLNFINQHSDACIVITESNMISLESLKDNNYGEVAIIPSHSFSNDYPFGIYDVTDSTNNQTRFLVIKPQGELIINKFHNVKATIVVTSINDRPGQLYDILGAFYKNNINLVSIVSRPTKNEIGKYHFFIELEGLDNTEQIFSTIEFIRRDKDVFVELLGVYENRKI